MLEKREEEISITQQLGMPRTRPPRPDVSLDKTPATSFSHEEYQVNDPMQAIQQETEIPFIPSAPKVVYAKQVTPQQSKRINKRDAAEVQIVQEQCRKLCLSAFFRERAPVRSLGFTSSIACEGKSFLAVVTAGVLANDSSNPVTLLECNWEHPNLHEYFGFPTVPGLAEWLRNECSAEDIRYQVSGNLTVIPAGNGKQDAVKLLQQVRQKGLLHLLASSNELVIVDLPGITTTSYAILAASLVESLIVVIRAGVTPDLQLAETCRQIKDLPVEGMILNQVKSRIPHWIQELLH
jgi:Mrp family chromosome partitioning ATPase